MPLINLLWCHLTMFCSFLIVFQQNTLHLPHHTCWQLTDRSWGDISCLWSCEEPLLGWHSGESSPHVGCPQRGPVHINNVKSIPHLLCAQGWPYILKVRKSTTFEMHLRWGLDELSMQDFCKTMCKQKRKWRKRKKVNWRFWDFKEIRWNNKRNNTIRRLYWCFTMLTYDTYSAELYGCGCLL